MRKSFTQWFLIDPSISSLIAYASVTVKEKLYCPLLSAAVCEPGCHNEGVFSLLPNNHRRYHVRGYIWTWPIHSILIHYSKNLPNAKLLDFFWEKYCSSMNTLWNFSQEIVSAPYKAHLASGRNPTLLYANFEMSLLYFQLISDVNPCFRGQSLQMLHYGALAKIRGMQHSWHNS